MFRTTFCGILNRDVRLYVVNLLVTFVAVPLYYYISHFKSYTLIMHGIEICI